jgi:hypothetical protein
MLEDRAHEEAARIARADAGGRRVQGLFARLARR